MARTRHGLSRAAFEALVEEALETLPPFFQSAMRNVAILTRTWPTSDELSSAGVPRGHTLLGLYNGIPLTERTSGYTLVPPDTITLYQGPIEAFAETSDEIPDIVRDTVIHEIAHHFGIDDDRLHELGAY